MSLFFILDYKTVRIPNKSRGLLFRTPFLNVSERTSFQTDKRPAKASKRLKQKSYECIKIMAGRREICTTKG